jgi:FtsP/CotA-like multicopper oxidase with cupredoxin domain
MSRIGTITRRRFLGWSASTVGLVAVGGLGMFTVGCEPPPGTNAARNRLKLPATIPADGATLRAEQATVDIGGGITTTALTYNGQFPGPTLEMVRGSGAAFRLDNGLDEPTTIHSHGMIAPTGMDGQPIDPVAPGATFDYAFPVVQRAGLSFYHPHPHGLTGKQVNLGLAGPIVVHDDEESALDLVGRYHEIPLIIRDAAFDSAGVLRYRATSSGFQGDTPLVNGTLDPNIGIDNALYRLRVLNGSNARVLQLALSDGAPFTIIGNDGGLLAAPATVLELTAAPAERFDLLVDFRGLGLGQTAMLQDLSSGWDLLEFEVTQEVDDTHQVPTGPLSTIEPLGAPVRTRDFSFEGMGKINGLSYDPARIDFSVPFGDTELWRFTTGGNAPHPVHVHGMPFQVQSRTGGRNQLFPWEAGWKDTVLLADGETVEALVRFDEYRGQYLIHCHQLEHEDNGMMLAFSVV